jgi:hypothetical protein
MEKEGKPKMKIAADATLSEATALRFAMRAESGGSRGNEYFQRV